MSSEIDKFANIVSEHNHPHNIQLGDITNWKSWGLDWGSIDLVLAGSPCQGFSLQGNQLAFDDKRSALYFVFVEILDHINSLNPNVKFMLENVPMKQEFLVVISKRLDVEPLVINSNIITAQSRKRYYWCNWDVELPEVESIDYTSVVTEPGMFPAVTRKGDPRTTKFTGTQFACLTATYYKGIRADGRPYVASEEGEFDELRASGKLRMLTPIECERLQTLPDNYTLGVSNTQRYKMLGNGWTLKVIKHIFKGL